jgi:membrane protein
MPDDQESDRNEPGRGREAEGPQQIPARGWKDILWRAWKQTGRDNISLVSGGVTYYVLLALFPGLATLVSIYGLFSSPAEVEKQVGALAGVMPGDAQNLIGAELHQLAGAPGGALGIGAVIGFLLGLWSASRGMGGVITALNIAYEQEEKRGYFKLTALSLLLTIGLVIGGLVVIAFVAGVPVLFNSLGLGALTRWLVYVLEWPVLMVFIMLILAVLYRYAPSRDEPQWQWASPGAIVATLLWLLGSIAFTVYVAHFGSYNKTYGSLGAIIVLLTWLYLSAYVVLLGAEINAEAERQTTRDSTKGEPKPMGRRGATAADTVGEAYGSKS